MNSSWDRFQDRQDAGRQLLRRLQAHSLQDPLILALPRGGVVVGFEIAVGLNAELDVLIARKLGAPGQPELAIGAVIDGKNPETIFNESLLKALHVPRTYLEEEIKNQLEEIDRRKEKYRGRHPDPRIADRVVILVDDGIATGATVKAALAALQRRKPARLILAVPVAPPDTFSALSGEVDEAICLVLPGDFQAVGQFYDDFHPVGDAEVIQLLEEARRRNQDGGF